MDQRIASAHTPDPQAIEFVRFCYRRRRVGWPELYDEMCAVAARGLFRGLGSDDLAGLGIGFSLFDMPALAGMAVGVINEEQARRRPMAVRIAAEPVPVMLGPEDAARFGSDASPGIAQAAETTEVPADDTAAAVAPVAAREKTSSPSEQTIDPQIRLNALPSPV